MRTFKIEKFNNGTKKMIRVIDMTNARESAMGGGIMVGERLFTMEELELNEYSKEEIIEDYINFEAGIKGAEADRLYELLINA